MTVSVTSGAPAQSGEAGPWTERDDGLLSLRGSRCQDCRAVTFPPLSNCTQCGSTAVDVLELEPTGSLYSFTSVHVGREPFQRHYLLGMVDLDAGVRITAQLDDAEHGLQLGDPVECYLGPVTADPDEPVLSYRFRRAGAR